MQYTAYVFIAPVIITMLFGVIIYAWKQRRAPAASGLLAFLITATGLLIGNTFELLAPSETATLFWARFEYIFLVSFPVAWLAFSMQFTRKVRWLHPSRFWIFGIGPVITLLLVVTNDQHGLIWRDYRFIQASGFLVIQVEHGLWFYVHMLAVYGVISIAVFLTAREYFYSHRSYRFRSIWTVIGAFIPLFFNLIYVFDLIPAWQKDYTPIGVGAAGLLFSVGVFYDRLVHPMPVARGRLFDLMPDGVLILDSRHHILDLNPAARAILGLGSRDPIGGLVGNVWPEGAGWFGDDNVRRSAAHEPATRGVFWVTQEVQQPGFKADGEPGAVTRRRAYELRIWPMAVTSAGEMGLLVMMSDVTRRVEAEQALRNLNEELEARVLARTDALARYARELESLASVSSALRKASNFSELIDTLLLETASAFAAGSGALFMLEDDKLILRSAYNLTGLDAGTSHSICEDPLWRSIQTGRLIHLSKEDLNVMNPAEGTLFGAIARGQSELLIAPLMGSNYAQGLLLLAFKQPLERPFDDYSRPMIAVAEMGGNAFQRVRATENLESLIHARTRSLSALYEVTTVTNQHQFLPDLLKRVLETLLDSLHLRAVVVHLFEEDGALRLAAYAGLSEQAVAQLPAPTDPDSPWQRVLERGGTLVLPNLETPVVFDRGAGQEVLSASVGVIVRTKQRVLGVLTVLDEDIGRYPTDDIALLAAVADHISVAVENASLRRKAEEAAVMEERQRLARDLHDSVTQSLYSLVLFTEAGKQALEAGDLDRAGGYFDRLRDGSQMALGEMRLLIYELRPQVLQSEGLAGALRRRVEAVEKRAGLTVNLEMNQQIPLPEYVETGLYGIAQEALNNIIKHACARNVNIRLTAEPCLEAQAVGPSLSQPEKSLVELEISDDGQGFNIEEIADGGGFGLSSMRERAKAMGGDLIIRSQPGRGTSVTCVLQMAQETEI
ncbi:MAG: GAF domain-containing protein [Chloroflexi bacterium]|nr:GAF domain-containing protein [Chloroflexota bacterium]